MLEEMYSKVNIHNEKHYLAYEMDNDIFFIFMIGRIQFIAKGFNGSYDNIDTLFFNDFHHVARWKLVVKEKESPEENEKIIVRYIPKRKWHFIRLY